jgi:Cu(I)/Ag(I) efflux system membrane protein CusA/SilA
LRIPRVVTLEVPPDEPWIETLPLRVQQRITRLDTNRIEVNLPVGVGGRVEIPAALQKFPVLAERDSESGVTWALGPMALRSEGSRRNQYVLLNVEGRGEVDVVREADARLREAIRSGEIELPPGSNFRWVGRYEQKIRADQTMRWVIGLSAVIMIGLIYAGTRSALVTAVIVGCNAVVATAGGFLFVWWWDAQMTTAVAVGFLVLLGVMFNDGILLSTYLHERFRDPPGHDRGSAASGAESRPAAETSRPYDKSRDAPWADSDPLGRGPGGGVNAADGVAGARRHDLRPCRPLLGPCRLRLVLGVETPSPPEGWTNRAFPRNSMIRHRRLW